MKYSQGGGYANIPHLNQKKLTMKKYITPEMEVIKMEITDSILANSFIDVGGNGTDHFDAQRKDSPVIWGKSETNKSLWE